AGGWAPGAVARHDRGGVSAACHASLNSDTRYFFTENLTIICFAKAESGTVGGMADVITGSGSGTALRCRYSGCRSVLVYSGRGRPPEYCAERRWPGGKTCKQLAAAGREAGVAAGLDVPVSAYREATGRVLPAVEGLAAQLAGVLAAMSAVEAGAVARIEQAEVAAVAAVERAQLAEAERDRATRLAQQARDEAAQAKDDARAAGRRGRAAGGPAQRRAGGGGGGAGAAAR